MKKTILARNIKKLRAFKNLNQTEFASLFNIKRSSIGAYEEGRAEPKLDTLIMMSDYFNLSIDELVKKELTINQITKFDENFKKYNTPYNQNDIEKELKSLKVQFNQINKKLDILLSKK